MYPQSFIKHQTDFVRMGLEHWLWILSYGVVFTILWIWYGRSQTDPQKQQKIGFYHGLFGIISWVLTTLVIYDIDGLKLTSLLPFHVCYFLNLVLPFIHKYRSFQIFNICYYWVMVACLQGVFTPDLEEAFPHYYNVRYFIVHIGLVQSILYALFVYKFKPTWQGIFKAVLAGNIYLGFTHLINTNIGTNFMYTMRKPPNTILDALGEHYLFEAQFLALLLFGVVYLPFFFRKRVLKNSDL
ncbi:MAG: TIGR02206 family membrane protein [Raineya sp.]|jgi:hypothetical integral membrane protein (TIGR02206 family)|nr:TIGR02206 family membrane protein [Raineya sp.]